MSRPKGYWTWAGMLARCNNKNAENYKWYGGRGIKVCARWRSFKNFISDMGEPPRGKTLDRIRADGDYKPSNCRWSDKKTQVRNTIRSKRFNLNGETRALTEWCEIYKIKSTAVSSRVNKMGWDLERALTTPVRKGNY